MFILVLIAQLCTLPLPDSYYLSSTFFISDLDSFSHWVRRNLVSFIARKTKFLPVYLSKTFRLNIL